MSLKNPVTPPGIDPGTVRLVAQCLNHYTTQAPTTTTTTTTTTIILIIIIIIIIIIINFCML
jgi:hypothetical protein